MKRLIYLLIVIIIIVFTSSAINNPSRTLSKQEVASLLYPDKHIEIDTLGKNQYIVRFMDGENEVNRLELLTQIIDIRKDTTSVNNKREDSLGLEEISVRGTIDTISTFYELTISEKRTKIAIKSNKKNKSTGYIYSFYRPKDFEETLYQPVQYYISADSILVYNEDGKLMYGLDAGSVGWDEYGDGWIEYKPYDPPYVFVREITDNGELIISNATHIGYKWSQKKVLNNQGLIIFDKRLRNKETVNNILSKEEEIYLLANELDSIRIYRYNTQTGEKDSISIENKTQVARNLIYEKNDTITLLYTKVKNVFINSAAEKLIEISFDSRLNELKKNEINTTKTIARGFPVVVEGDIYFIDKEDNEVNIQNMNMYQFTINVNKEETPKSLISRDSKLYLLMYNSAKNSNYIININTLEKIKIN